MDISALLLMGALLASTSALALRLQGFQGVREGFLRGMRTLRVVAPMLLTGLALAGFINVVVSPGLISQWMGSGSGLVGIFIGIGAGALIPGGPYVSLPIAAAIYDKGAGVGPIAAFLTAWSTIPISRSIVWELPFLGGSFTFVRYIVNLAFPLVAGLLTPPIFDLLV